MTPTDADREWAREILYAWAPEWDVALHIGTRSSEAKQDLEEAIAAALAEARERAVERYAFTVDDPRRAHLHYDDCPFKPYAAARADDIPDPRPVCTCAETHKAAYWKGQLILERGYLTLAQRERDEALRKSALDQRQCDEMTAAAEAARRARPDA